jgi:dTDP-4-amino-4,6-dideoxygalactose transaminase
VEAALTPRTRAILCVHQMGMPCDLAAILALAGRHRIPVIEDAACAAGSEIRWGGNWERIGKPHGDIACFSFHPRKVISTGDGGMITTSNSDWDRRARLLRQHAMSVPDTVRHAASRVIFESYPELGYNYRMTDLQAAVGRVQLERLPGLVRRRRELASRYRDLLAGVDGLELPADTQWTRSNWQSYCVRLPRGCEQRGAMQRLLERGISTRRGIMCSHREPVYAALGDSLRLPQSEAAQDRCLLLPLHAEMTAGEQERVAAGVRDVCASRG